MNIFDRLDYSLNLKDTLHLNLFLARNRFQTLNEFDQQAVGQDQRQLVNSVNIAPGYVHIFSPTTVLSVNPYYRLDNVKYFASPDQFSDQPIIFYESRRLNNVGIKSDLSYVKGRNNAKFGVSLRFTVLNLTNKEALYKFQSTFSDGCAFSKSRFEHRGEGRHGIVRAVAPNLTPKAAR